MNIYDLVNEELKRLYAERDMLIRLFHEEAHRNGRIGAGQQHAENARFVGMEIAKFRAAMLETFTNHDEKIQEKIAELALTGDSDGEIGL